jgi:hypothetical protein
MLIISRLPRCSLIIATSYIRPIGIPLHADTTTSIIRMDCAGELQSSAVQGVVEVEEDGPEDGGGEENGGDFAACGEGEAPSGVRAVAFAEAVFEGGTRAALAGGVQVKALRGGL